MKLKRICLISLLFMVVCFVGVASAATENLTVVYDTSGTNSFSTQISGYTYITVKATDNTYHYYSPATDKLLTTELSGGTWQTVYGLGDGSTSSSPSSSSDGYIQGTGTQYIDTGTYFNSNTDSFSIGYMYSGLYDGNGALLGGGLYTSSNGEMNIAYPNSAQAFRIFFFTSGSIKTDYTFYNSKSNTTKHLIDYSDYKIYLDNAQVSSTTVSLNTDYTITLFANNRGGSPAGIGTFKIYSYSFSDNGVISRNYIPIQIGTSGEYALYDISFKDNGNTKVIYHNDGSGTFLGGGTKAALIYEHSSDPEISAVSVTSTSPAETGSTVSVTATLSSVPSTDAGTVTFYTSTTPTVSSSWVSVGSKAISTQSSAGVISHSFTGSSSVGTYYIKAILSDTTQSVTYDSYTDGNITNIYVVLYVVPEISAVAVNPYVLDLSVSSTVQLSSSIINPEGVSSMVWQQNKDNGGWTNTSLTQSTGSITVSSAGTYLYRLLIIPVYGSVITSSNTHNVVAGYYPSAQITSPSSGSQYGVGETINITATASDYTSFSWDFGSGVKAYGNTNTLTPWVQYSSTGGHTITLTVTNSFGSKSTSVSVSVSTGSKRPLASSTPAPIPDSQAIVNWTTYLEPQSAEDQSPDIWGMFTGFTKPFTSVMGQWFYLALFAIPYLLIWIKTRNTMIPSIIGILFGSWLLVMLPSTAMAAAICILVLSVSGGIFGIFLTRRQRE